MPWAKLSDTLTKYHRDKQLHAAYICSVAQQVIGDEARVVSFRNGTLVLAVPSSPQAANIQIQSAQIIVSINQKLGAELISQLRFRVS